MARRQLRDTTVYMRDGFSGTAAINDLSMTGGDTTFGVDTLDLRDEVTVVPVGARFTVAGMTGTRTVTAANSNKVFNLISADAASGTITLSVNGESLSAVNWNDAGSVVQTAIEGEVGAGNVTVTGTGIVTGWTIEFKGTLAGLSTPTVTIASDTLMDSMPAAVNATLTTTHAGAVTHDITFSPALDAGDMPTDGDAITFTPILLTIKTGDGDLSFDETYNYEYDLDRGRLDGVRQGDDEPCEANFAIVWEEISSGTDLIPTPYEALNRLGPAAAWVNADADPCTPFGVDIIFFNQAECGSDVGECVLFPAFRKTSISGSVNDSEITVSGTINRIQPVVWSGGLDDEPEWE